MAPPKGANPLIEARLADILREIESALSADCLFYNGHIAFGADDRIRDAVEGLTKRRRKLVFILETSGGFAETARRISDALRYHYREVDFLIPSYAMSAGTILALSGNAILMDYYSVLGPIERGEAGAAELQILLGFDQGELYAYRQARALSLALLEEWLAKYKFKNWAITKTRKLPVTNGMRKKRAIEIAEKLNDIGKWNSHGIGINMQRLRRDLKLYIDDFGRNRVLRTAVRNHHTLVLDYSLKMGFESVVQTREIFDGRRWGG